MIDDIPEATREGLSIPQRTIKKNYTRLLLLIGLMILGAIAFGLISFIRPQFSTSSGQDNVSGSQLPPNKTERVEASPVDIPPVEPEKKSDTNPPQPLPESVVKDDLLGHLPYQEADSADLVAVTNDGQHKLHQAAAAKFLQMQADAKASGVGLAIISGFRDHESQKHLFFTVKEQRVQATKKRAEVSAPPGYSEHHTGYALDIGDAKEPATHLETDFEQTAAFNWLQKNAAKYSFELSFPRDNPQGISYEPWHWRFVGDTTSLKTFRHAINLSKSQNEEDVSEAYPGQGE